MLRYSIEGAGREQFMLIAICSTTAFRLMRMTTRSAGVLAALVVPL